MSAKPEKKSTSWADEAEDEEPVVQAKPVWAKTHNWGANNQAAAAAPAPVKGNYDKNFPPPGVKDDFPPPSASSSKGASQQTSRPQQSQSNSSAGNSAAPAPRRQESDDFRGPSSSSSSSSSSQERPHREYAARDYPARERTEGNSYPARERNEEREGSFRRNEDREGGFTRRGGDNDYRGGRRGDDDRRGGDRRYDNRGGEGRRDYGREAADRRDEREGFHAVGRRGDHGNHSRDFDRHDDRNQDREGGDNRRGGRNFGFDNRREHNNDREERQERPHYERKEREVAFPEAAPFTCFLANLSYEVNQAQLTAFFEEKGFKIESVKIPAGIEGAANKGFAYVEFADLEDLKKAVESTGTTIAGRPVKISVAEPQKERPKLNLNPRSASAPSDEVKKTESEAKSNPFGAAKPRDELAILQKKEEERKQREEKLKEEKEKEQPSTEESEKKSETESPKESSESTPEKPKKEDQKLYVAKKDGAGSGYKDQRGGKSSNREPREGGERRTFDREPREGGERKTFDREPREGKPFERSERGSFRGRGGSDRGRKDGNRGGRGGFRDGGDRTFKKEEGSRSSNAPKEQQAESFKASHANPFDALGEDEE
eukprot:TRINITY_DN1339_c0_g1_i4.p1 TRINITY_DN1339_c0_g1~~TRINITY_DN1339_c0_g1_i4.p1  ORF type:complete len:603 (+),score=349.10 TRINITY_DN1339_c0_g1_i4:178-1986(+)